MTRPPSMRDAPQDTVPASNTTGYRRFENPEALARDARVSASVKIRLLNDWAQDLTARLQASDENMVGGEPGRAGDLLRRVHVCLEGLEEPGQRH
jgi:hypothetical protein